MAMRVLKFGGSSLANIDLLKSVAQRVFEMHKQGDQVLLVVSAMGSSTNDLISLAQQVSNQAHPRELDMLISTGERVAMSLMSIALNDLGCPAISFTGSQAGVLTDSSHTGANIVEVKAYRVLEELQKNKVVVLAGFQGVCPETKEITTLGRGGTDTTAVAMADFLKADSCEMYKDFEGIFQMDPRANPQARPIQEMSYDQLREICSAGAKVVHTKAVDYAKKTGVKLHIRKAHPFTKNCTLVSSESLFPENCIALNHNLNVTLVSSTDKSIDSFRKTLLSSLEKVQNSDLFIIDCFLDQSQPKAFLRGSLSSIEFLKNAMAKQEVEFSHSLFHEVNLCFSERITPVSIDGAHFLHQCTYGKTLSYICTTEDLPILRDKLSTLLQ